MPVKPDHDAAQAAIEHLVANPPPPRQKPLDTDNFGSCLNILANVDDFRRKLAADRGMTYEQWIAMEHEVRHPTEIIPVEIGPEWPKIIGRRRMLGARVPEEFIANVCDREPDNCKPMQAMREFAGKGEVFHVLSGGKGTRKSGSASWLLSRVDDGAFISALDVVQVSLEKKERWEHIVEKAPVVVLDDLGWEKRTGDLPVTFGDAFSKLVDKVYGSRNRRLVITCNLSKETFQKTYGEREFDRIRQYGRWTYVAGESVRHYQEREPGSDDE